MFILKQHAGQSRKREYGTVQANRSDMHLICAFESDVLVASEEEFPTDAHWTCSDVDERNLTRQFQRFRFTILIPEIETA